MNRLMCVIHRSAASLLISVAWKLLLRLTRHTNSFAGHFDALEEKKKANSIRFEFVIWRIICMPEMKNQINAVIQEE